MTKDYKAIVSEYGAAFIAIDAADMASWRGDFAEWNGIERHPTDQAGFKLQRSGKTVSLLLVHDLFTAFLAQPKGAVLVRGGEHFKSRKQVERLVASVPAKAWKKFRKPWSLSTGRLLVFDSSANGDQGMKELRAGSEGGVIDAQLRAGTYSMSWAEHDSYDFIRLELSGKR